MDFREAFRTLVQQSVKGEQDNTIKTVFYGVVLSEQPDGFRMVTVQDFFTGLRFQSHYLDSAEVIRGSEVFGITLDRNYQRCMILGTVGGFLLPPNPEEGEYSTPRIASDLAYQVGDWIVPTDG